MAAPLHRPWTQHAGSPAEKVEAEGIRAEVTIHDRDGIRSVARLRPLSRMCKVLTEHRKALKNNLGYNIRDRDPPR